LSGADVDLANALLTIRDTKFFKSRLVPIGQHLTGVLTDYDRWRATTYPSAVAGNPFFLGKRGAAIHLMSDSTLVRQTGVAPARGAPPPDGDCILVLFGASGALTRRLLTPAIYNLACDGLLPRHLAIVGVARDAIGSPCLR
jgi:hypothetical protein